MIIRPAVLTDIPDLRQALVELQDVEQRLHPTRRPGEQVADACLDWMRRRAATAGAILVAALHDRFAGFVAGWVEQTDNLGETMASNRFGYISDVCVMPAFRGKRIAGRLLHEMELHFQRAGVTRLRIGVLAGNASARASYERSGFRPYEILYERVMDSGEDA